MELATQLEPKRSWVRTLYKGTITLIIVGGLIPAYIHDLLPLNALIAGSKAAFAYFVPAHTKDQPKSGSGNCPTPASPAPKDEAHTSPPLAAPLPTGATFSITVFDHPQQARSAVPAQRTSTRDTFARNAARSTAPCRCEVELRILPLVATTADSGQREPSPTSPEKSRSVASNATDNGWRRVSDSFDGGSMQGGQYPAVQPSQAAQGYSAYNGSSYPPSTSGYPAAYPPPATYGQVPVSYPTASGWMNVGPAATMEPVHKHGLFSHLKRILP